MRNEDEGLWSIERAEQALRRNRSTIESAAGELAESGWHEPAEVVYLLCEEPPSRKKVARAIYALETAEDLHALMETMNVLSEVAHLRERSDAVDVFADIFEYCKWVAGQKANGEDDDAE